MAENGKKPKEALEDVKRKEKGKEKSFTGRRLLTLINTSPYMPNIWRTICDYKPMQNPD